MLIMADDLAESAPCNTLNFGQFISKFDNDTKTFIRKHEKFLNKLTRLKSSVVFNNSCIIIEVV